MDTDARLDNIAEAARRRDGEQAPLLIGLMLAEETGEAIQQLRRHLGHARQPATSDDVGAELADVVISASLLARLVGTDLTHQIEAKLQEGVR